MVREHLFCEGLASGPQATHRHMHVGVAEHPAALAMGVWHHDPCRCMVHRTPGDRVIVVVVVMVGAIVGAVFVVVVFLCSQES